MRLNIRRQVKEALKYIKEVRNSVYAVIGVFLLSSIIGFVYAEQFSILDSLIRDIISKTANLNMFELILFILQNNIQSSFLGVILGVFLGIYPLISTGINGILLGYITSKVAEQSGIIELWRILPHGVFELPAVFISLGMGLYFGGFFFAKNKKRELIRRFYNSINVFLFIVIPLLIIASVIEGLLIAITNKF